MRLRSVLFPRLYWSCVALLGAILVTGGFRWGWLDLRSLGFWAFLAATFFAFGDSQAIDEPGPFGRKVRDLLIKAARHPFRILSALALGMILAQFLRYYGYRAHFSDAGFLYQPFFHTFNPRFLHCDGCVGSTYLGEHQAYTLALMKIWTLLIPSPYWIPAAGVLIGAATVWLAVRNVREELRAPIISYVVIALFSIRGFTNGLLFDFREDVLGAFFFAVALVSLRSGGFFGVLLGGVLAAFSKESAAMVFPFFGVMLWLDRDGRKLSPPRRAAILGVSIAILAYCFGYLIPYWNRGGANASVLVERFGALGKTPSEILINLALHPYWAFSRAGITPIGFVRDHLHYLFFTVGPFVPFMIRAWSPLYLPGLVVVAGNLASPVATQRGMIFHYDLLVLPFFAFGLVDSLRALEKEGRFPRRFKTLTLLFFLACSSLWPASFIQDGLALHERWSDVDYLRERSRAIPEETIVAADPLTYPHFVDRPNLRLYPDGSRGRKSPDDASYAFLLTYTYASTTPEWRAKWERVDCSPSNFVCQYRNLSR